MWDSCLILLSGLGLAVVVKGIVAEKKRNPRGLPLPPGPKGLPLLGNIFQLPQVLPWEGYRDLCKEYGDIVYLNALGQGILVLGSQRRAVDLLDKKATNYSDRPVIPITDMMYFNWNFGLMPYGGMWRQHRRSFHQLLNNNVVQRYHPIIYEETKTFLRNLKSNPEGVFEHLQSLFGTTIMRTAYGFDDIRQNETLIHDADTLASAFTEAAVPGKFLVNIFPFLKHVPSWLPGAGFQKHFAELAQLSFKTVNSPFEEAKRDFNRAELETVARNVCSVAYIAGVDTACSSGTALLYVLASYPHVQAKAQAEIDTVIGSDRLPLVTDRAELPYVHAIVKEIGRWYTVVPLGVAHANAEADEYEGYFIPKGTFVLQNNWAMMHDPELFDQPFEFNPERYLRKDGQIDPSVPDAEAAAFGHGRRICPGRHFSNDTLFVMAAFLLATYNVSASKDEDGNVIPMKLELKNPAISE
ncbi:hypothetical protein H1R20_g4913, partial [Candolleomyces eurysporus]